MRKKKLHNNSKPLKIKKIIKNNNKIKMNQKLFYPTALEDIKLTIPLNSIFQLFSRL